MPANPVILTIDDEPEVLRSVERDLRKQYSQHYRVMSANSGQAALDLLQRLEQRNDPVALLLVDHRMPQMNGIEFLSRAMPRHPGAKRVLLTAYADTEAAIRAINEVKLDHYLLKPWDPPEQKLYPVLDDLLDDWKSSFRPPFEGWRVVGSRWSPKTYEIREFLARNGVPYQWLDPETADNNPDLKRLLDDLQSGGVQLPAVLFSDAERVSQPSAAELAERLDLHTRAGADFYDVVIVGAGPAGLAAAVYGASEGLRSVIVERDAPGGQASLSSRIENYLGFPSGLSGSDLTRRAVAQARRFGAEIISPQLSVSARCNGPYRIVSLGDGCELSCQALLIATGVQWRKLDVPGLERLQGAGVYYGAGPAEAISCQDEDVYIVGGANSAGQAAMNFSKYARRVFMLVRGPSLTQTMSQYLIDEIGRTPTIEVRCGTQVVEARGETRLEEIAIHCADTNSVEVVPASALFIFIGAQPSTEWLDGIVERDERGFILTGPALMKQGQRPKGWPLDRDPTLFETSVPGIFAIGDVRHGSVKRVAAGVGEGSMAIQFVHQYLAQAPAVPSSTANPAANQAVRHAH